MSKPTILVTGAVGKTAAPVVEQLLERGYPVRALVRREDERSRPLAELGAEVVSGDLLNIASVRSVVEGVRRIYFCYPPLEGLLAASTNVAAAARDAGVEAVVNMSQISAREQAGSSLSRQHWLAERVLDWADIGAAHINPGYFAENLVMFNAANIAQRGKIVLPYGAERHAPIAARDIARVVRAMLVDPAPYVGKRHVLTGPRNMTIAEMAAVFSQKLGKPVAYEEVTPAQWRDMLSTAGLPEFLVDHLVHVAKDHRDGVFSAETDVVERVTGAPPQSLEDFIEENRAVFVASMREVA